MPQFISPVKFEPYCTISLFCQHLQKQLDIKNSQQKSIKTALLETWRHIFYYKYIFLQRRALLAVHLHSPNNTTKPHLQYLIPATESLSLALPLVPTLVQTVDQTQDLDHLAHSAVPNLPTLTLDLHLALLATLALTLDLKGQRTDNTCLPDPLHRTHLNSLSTKNTVTSIRWQLNFLFSQMCSLVI